MTRLGALIAADGLITAAVCCGQIPVGAMLAAWGCGLAASIVRRNRDRVITMGMDAQAGPLDVVIVEGTGTSADGRWRLQRFEIEPGRGAVLHVDPIP